MPNKAYIHEGNSSSGEGMNEAETNTAFLTKVNLDLAYSSEKLVNLHEILMHLLGIDKYLEIMAIKNGHISAISIEKELEFDLLSVILDSEVRQVEHFMGNIQAEIVDVCDKISSCRHSTEVLTKIEEKLHGSEQSLKKSQEQLLEVKVQSAKFQRAVAALRCENRKDSEAMVLSSNGQQTNMTAYLKRQTAEQQKHILRMLEKSLAREVVLEKKLSELRQDEQQLKLRMHYTEQVAFHMEEAAEVVWGRFLESENAAEVLMGISKELVGRLQIVQSNLKSSFQRETELESKLQPCLQQLDVKDAAIKTLENSIAEHIMKSSQVPALIEKVKFLEEQLKKSVLCLENANGFNEESQEQLNEMGHIIESLKESTHEAESRVKIAESKVVQLTDSNLELTEEINFLKSSQDVDKKRMSLLEKQLRESEIQLQYSKSSSEANQEQQNMLYAAIWDMETLIEDLKSKVSNAESKTESTEEQCIILSEANLELNREVSFLRSRVKDLEISLNHANRSKAASAEEIDLRTRLIMDTVMQLARERECIQNQLISLSKKSKIPVKQRNANIDPSATIYENEYGNDEELLSAETSKETCRKASEEAMYLSRSYQVDKGPEDAHLRQTEEGTCHFPHEHACTVSKAETAEDRREKAGGRSNFVAYAVKAIFVALVSAIAVHMLDPKTISL